ncbi:MAG: hypothetical protein ACTSPI_12305 [Candidatus Heimdallarchaeaceae archaeon]
MRCKLCKKDKPSFYSDFIGRRKILDLCFGCGVQLGYVDVSIIDKTKICLNCNSRFIPQDNSRVCDVCISRENRRSKWLKM